VNRWLAHLQAKTTPEFGQLVNWALLASALLLACLPFDVREGDPAELPATVVSWLPRGVIFSPISFWTCRALLLVGTLLWFAMRWLPWSCWLTTAAFTVLWSLHVETTYNTAHIFNMANMLLVIQSLWITAEAPAIRVALREGRYYDAPLLPRWVVLTGIAYIGIFHTAAGLSKLVFSGAAWANGTSLQLWTHLWGHWWSPTTWLVLGDRRIAALLQGATLVIETAGILALVPRLRVWIGLGLIAFYAGVLFTFDYGFHLNALFTALYLLPVDRWLARRRSLLRRELLPTPSNG
jgi:hypothetical protein